LFGAHGQAAFAKEKSPNHFWKGLFNLVAWDGIEPAVKSPSESTHWRFG
jgi:hypothetical protein